MADFNIDHYEISICVEDSSTEEKLGRTIRPKIYPDLNETNDATCTVVLTKASVQESQNFREWLLRKLDYQQLASSTKIAIIEEIGEVRCVTYEELLEGLRRTANYMSHHSIKSGDKILMCMENCVEYVFYLLGAIFIGAIPVLINPSHIASDKIHDIGFTSAVVDLENYTHILRASRNILQELERVFVISDDIAEIKTSRYMWVIDGLGFLSFAPKFDDKANFHNECAFILSESKEKFNYIAHTQKSSYHFCKNYYNVVCENYKEILTAEDKTHIIANGLHCHDVFSYLWYILANGETCVLSESTLDIWRASFLDRLAGMIDRYHVTMLMTNTQMLKCFIKYNVNRLYDLTSLKVITNHGPVVSVSTAKEITETLHVILLQTYSGIEFGVASFGIATEGVENLLANCGTPFSNIKIKIAHLDTEKEVKKNEWGQIIVNGNTLFGQHLMDKSSEDRFAKTWLKTGDYGMIDNTNKLHFEGPIKNLIRAQGKKEVSSELIECALCEHQHIDDSVVLQNADQVWCGLLMKDNKKCPKISELEKILKRNNIFLTISRVVVLDFIPRSENGHVMREEIPYLMRREENVFKEEKTESYV